MYETATHQAARIARERAEADAKLAKLKLDYANSPEERVRVAREDLARLKSDPYPLQRGSQDIAALERQVKVDKRNFAAAAGRMTEHETLDMAFDRSKPNRCFHGQMNMR